MFRKIATIAERTEEVVSTTRFCWDDRRLLPIVQRYIDHVRGEQPAIFETHAGDSAPSKNLIPLRFELAKNTNPHLDVIKLDGEDLRERYAGP